MKSEDLIRSAEILRDNCKSYGDDDDCEGCPFAGKDTVCRLTSVIHPAEWDVYLSREETDSDHSAEARNMVEDHFREVTKKVEPERPAKVGETITRADILDRAKAIVTGEREKQYGKPEDNFAIIAELWGTYTGYKFSPVDVAMMMALLKVARIKTGVGTVDSFVDLAGYAACAGEIAERNATTRVQTAGDAENEETNKCSGEINDAQRAK